MQHLLLLSSSAFRVGLSPPRVLDLSPLAARSAPRAHVAAVRMEVDIWDEFVETDPNTGESKSLSMSQKERRYLDCLDAYYNEGGKQLLADDEYEQLKQDLAFEGARVTTFSADEIKFVLANKRFKMGTPVLDDAAYDALRVKLKDLGSLVVLHEDPKCSVDGICKSDLRVDKGKTRLLYVPGFAGSLIAFCELSFWTLHVDPLLSIVLGAVPAYFLGNAFTENIFAQVRSALSSLLYSPFYLSSLYLTLPTILSLPLPLCSPTRPWHPDTLPPSPTAQKPLITQSSCPSCNSLLNVYFGDLFSVQTDSAAAGGKFPKPGDEVCFKCLTCKDELVANRAKMIVSTVNPKVNQFFPGQEAKA